MMEGRYGRCKQDDVFRLHSFTKRLAAEGFIDHMKVLCLPSDNVQHEKASTPVTHNNKRFPEKMRKQRETH